MDVSQIALHFFAHSENSRGEKHRLKDHLSQTAELARSFAPTKKLEQLFYLAGLLHDVGKFQDGFQLIGRTNENSIQIN